MRFREIQWATHGDWENCVRSQGAYLEGDWGVIVLRTMFLISCIFSNKCLCFSYYMADTFWTDLVYTGVELLSYMVSICFTWGDRQTLFQNDCVVLHGHQQDCMRILISPLLPQQLRYVFFDSSWILAVLVGWRWCPAVVLICIFLVAHDVRILMPLLAICVFPLEIHPFISFAYF